MMGFVLFLFFINTSDVIYYKSSNLCVNELDRVQWDDIQKCTNIYNNGCDLNNLGGGQIRRKSIRDPSGSHDPGNGAL